MSTKSAGILEIPTGLTGAALLAAVNDRIRQINSALGNQTSGSSGTSPTTTPYVPTAQTAPLAPILGTATVTFSENVFNWAVPVTLQADQSRVSCYMQAQLYSNAGHTVVLAPWYNVAPEIPIAGSGTWYSSPYIYAAAGNYVQLRAAAVSTGGLVTYSNVINADVASHATASFSDLIIQSLGANVVPALAVKDNRAGHATQEYQLRVGGAADQTFDLYDLTGGASRLQVDTNGNVVVVLGNLTLTLGNLVVTAGYLKLTPILSAALLGTDGTGKIITKAANSPTGLNGGTAPTGAWAVGTDGSGRLVAASNPVSGATGTYVAALAKLTVGGTNGSLTLGFADGLLLSCTYVAPT